MGAKEIHDSTDALPESVLKRFNGIDLDLSRVDHIEFYMRNDGEYYFDAVSYQ